MSSDEAVAPPIPATATTLLQALLRRPTTMAARQIAPNRNAAESNTCTHSTALEAAQTTRRGVDLADRPRPWGAEQRLRPRVHMDATGRTRRCFARVRCDAMRGQTGVDRWSLVLSRVARRSCSTRSCATCCAEA